MIVNQPTITSHNINFDLRSVKRSLLALSAVGAFGLATVAPASAAVIINSDGVQTDQNVLFFSSTETASPTLIAETNQTNTNVTFSNALGLFANASGQSSTTTSSDGLFGVTQVMIAAGSIFTTASFNIAGIAGNPPPAEAGSVLVEALGLGGGVIGSNTLTLSGNGENRIGISGTSGELFSGFRLSLIGGGVDSLSQVRLGGVATPMAAAVPEPTTWMLMLIGMAGVGFSMRRKRDTTLRVRYT